MIGLLKFITCGSVDDGKSTLIGHILYDSKLLYADQEKSLELDSVRLEAERERLTTHFFLTDLWQRESRVSR